MDIFIPPPENLEEFFADLGSLAADVSDQYEEKVIEQSPSLPTSLLKQLLDIGSYKNVGETYKIKRDRLVVDFVLRRPYFRYLDQFEKEIKLSLFDPRDSRLSPSEKERIFEGHFYVCQHYEQRIRAFEESIK